MPADCGNQDARALFLGLMYEVPSFGRAYFEANAIGKRVIVGIGADGLQFLDADDQERSILGNYDFNAIESFTCSSEVNSSVPTSIKP